MQVKRKLLTAVTLSGQGRLIRTDYHCNIIKIFYVDRVISKSRWNKKEY